ncbi:MAG: hypothetical protein U0936_03295 [Planctomycetaceae bacterium]
MATGDRRSARAGAPILGLAEQHAAGMLPGFANRLRWLLIPLVGDPLILIGVTAEIRADIFLDRAIKHLPPASRTGDCELADDAHPEFWTGLVKRIAIFLYHSQTTTATGRQC